MAHLKLEALKKGLKVLLDEFVKDRLLRPMPFVLELFEALEGFWGTFDHAEGRALQHSASC